MPFEGRAIQLLVPVGLNGALVNGTLIDSGSSLSMVSATVLAALQVPPSIEQFTSRAPKIVNIGGSPLHVLSYVIAAVVVSDVEVRHPLVVFDKLVYPMLIKMEVLRPHSAIAVAGTSDVDRLQLDRCPVCIE